MIILEINTLSFGSTGSIMFNIAKKARECGNTVFTFSTLRPKQKKLIDNNHTYFGTSFGYYTRYLLGFFFGLNDCLSSSLTKKMIKKIESIKPDIIHLHVIHGQFINLKLFFDFIIKSKIPIIWTFHDCWAFTGRCPHFQLTNCNKWISGCHNCVYPKRNYPASLIDTSERDWVLKKELFSRINDLTIVTPSNWLLSIVKKSFLKDKTCTVINNGIDLNLFKPTPSLFREKYNIKQQYIVLGVANIWNRRKGLDVFSTIVNILNPCKYKIVLIGDVNNNDELDEKILNVKFIDRNDLAGVYSSSTVFVNPTREDTFPTVNMEALACGIPIVTFKTGGSPEIINDKCGCVVDVDDITSLTHKIVFVCENKPFKSEDCIDRARCFDANDKFEEYVNLYNRITNNETTNND